MSGDCLFCGIVAGDVPADIVERTQGAVAFRDINPQAPTHILIVPSDHVPSAADLGRHSGETLAEVFSLAARLARREGLEGGWRLLTNVGPGAGQSVFHLHFHLLGGRPLAWPPG